MICDEVGQEKLEAFWPVYEKGRRCHLAEQGGLREKLRLAGLGSRRPEFGFQSTKLE